MTSPEQQAIAVELERLRGITEAGFARLHGRLDVVLQRTDRAEQDVRRLREDFDQDLAELRAEVEALKRGRWPLPAVGALTGVGALAVADLQYVGR
ncbi:hypothetical protein OG946_13985 [Streptomyces sp. NBC_01808]|uniref:hypothetical protein n=1 Tax=Streptomyces sp. NBC_01808 TaxID=2975947 RepID=UPI002DDAE1F6|nr:hypothetical protein [Streptomyces sp. NBC_01808]WSA38388.1 hypothetical protein OG946_13985 [Streptomyces sp. NBC_01808]